MRRIILSIMAAGLSMTAMSQDLRLNDLKYFERQGVNVLVYNNSFNGGFNDEKNSGIEIIHHGVRTVQGGAVRLNSTPEQWDLVPKMTDHKVDKEKNTIEVGLRYDDYDFDSRIVVTGKGETVEIAVWLDKPVPAALEGKAGFNLEFLPSQYWLKTFLMDGRLNRFPRYAVSQTVTLPNSEKPRQFKGFKTYDDRGTNRFVEPLPIDSGHSILMAPDAPERMVRISSDDAELKLYDGRMLAQNGWYVLRSVLPSGKTGKVVTWTIEPHAIPNWIREPNIGFSQVGYIPEQPKVAVIELDKKDTVKPTASLYRIKEDGSIEEAYKGNIKTWGNYYKYNYVKFDFSAVKQPGIYYIQYGDTKTNNFLIDNNVYDKITDATTDVWIPIHMNHMAVNEGYRMWHGEPFKEGYLQAPPSDHFDLHAQGETTDTKYKPYELIPGLNVGGFFDAGDFDIETHSNISVVHNLVKIWELFKPQRDETFVSQEQRYVDLHRPDGVPDILQYIEHGTLNLVAQAEQIGHMASALSNSVLDNYHHLGDAASITDGLHYDPSLKPYEVSADGKRSGTPDDMWAFTTRNPSLDYQAATMFASAYRALKGYNDDLAERALAQSKRLMAEATELMKKENSKPSQGRPWARMGNMATNLQLYGATREEKYLVDFNNQIWDALDKFMEFSIQTALDAVPYMDEDYKQRLRPYVEKYKAYIAHFDEENPYGVPIGLGNWAGGGGLLNFGTTVCFAHLYFPDIIGTDDIYRAANWLFGCHPYHNYSFVAAVGVARPKAVFYGNNRADFSFIPGNVAPGLLFRQPDHFENFDDWPFLWGQNEGTIAGNTQYVIFGSALKQLVKRSQATQQVAFGNGTLSWKIMAGNAVRFHYAEGAEEQLPEWLYVTDEAAEPDGIEVSVNAEQQTVEVKDRSGQTVFTATEHQLKKGTVAGEPTQEARLAFASPNDEYLYGLGQFQDGYLNVRGLSRRLTQVNTQISIPMLISNKGYGLLWNNYGMTEFNPCDQQIRLEKQAGTGKSEVVNVTSTEGGRQEVRERNIYTATLNIKEAGDYALLLDVGQKMARRHNLTIDGETVIEMQNLWLPPTASQIVHLTAGKHQLTAELANGDQPILHYGKVSDQTVISSPVAQAIDYTVFVGSADEIIASYRHLTGEVPMIPQWALGYIHCRERFHSQDELLATAKEFRDLQLPADVMVQDWQYWGKNGWNSMAFDTDNYPNPKQMTDSLHRMNLRLMLSVWSKVDKSSKVGQQLEHDGHFIPGTDWVDFFNPESADAYWRNFSQRLVPLGIDAWWQDATEPENDDLEGRRVMNGRYPGEVFRNVYPLLVNKTVYEGLRHDLPAQRTMILTRCGFPGIQRYGSALWSGDVGNDWETFRRQIAAGLGMQAAGIPWWTYDAGGFFRPRDQHTNADYIERMLRWIETSVYLPLMRVHGYMSDTEPWRYGKEAQEVIADCLRERYRLLPYIYSSAAAVSRVGSTLMRPLVFDFADDPEALRQQHEYMFGQSLLISPVTEPGVSEWRTYLPKTAGGWYDYHTNKHYEGGQYITMPVTLARIPVFVKAGSILPIGQDSQYTSEHHGAEIELRVYPGADATFTLYEDDGESMDYEQGKYNETLFEWNDQTRQLNHIRKAAGYDKAATFRTVVL